jgi:HSP20 family molecular chaperone IbpA
MWLGHLTIFDWFVATADTTEPNWLRTAQGESLGRDQTAIRNRLRSPNVAPVVDIIEDETEYLIKVDLPEIKKEESRLLLENGVLVLSGERKLEREKKAENITVLSGPMGALGAVSAYLTMRMPRR